MCVSFSNLRNGTAKRQRLLLGRLHSAGNDAGGFLRDRNLLRVFRTQTREQRGLFTGGQHHGHVSHGNVFGGKVSFTFSITAICCHKWRETRSIIFFFFLVLLPLWNCWAIPRRCIPTAPSSGWSASHSSWWCLSPRNSTCPCSWIWDWPAPTSTCPWGSVPKPGTWLAVCTSSRWSSIPASPSTPLLWPSAAVRLLCFLLCIKLH